MSSHIIFEAITDAEMNNRWPEEPFAAGKRALRRCRRYKAANVTEGCRRVRWSAYAMKWSRRRVGVDEEAARIRGTSGHVKRSGSK